MKYLLVSLLLLSGCGTGYWPQYPKAVHDAELQCGTYGGLSYVIAREYDSYVYYSAGCKDGTGIDRRITKE